MPTNPTGYLSTPLAAMRDLVASSAAFQAWAGVADKAEALERVHLLVVPEGSPRPLALIDFGDFARERVALTNRIAWQQRSGSNLVVWFQADVAADAVEPDATLAFCNQVGAVWLDMETSAGQYDQKTFAANLIEMVVAPVRIPEEQRNTAGDYFECALSPSFTRQP